jgi:hypothetical protein
MSGELVEAPVNTSTCTEHGTSLDETMEVSAKLDADDQDHATHKAEREKRSHSKCDATRQSSRRTPLVEDLESEETSKSTGAVGLCVCAWDSSRVPMEFGEEWLTSRTFCSCNLHVRKQHMHARAHTHTHQSAEAAFVIHRYLAMCIIFLCACMYVCRIVPCISATFHDCHHYICTHTRTYLCVHVLVCVNIKKMCMCVCV